jgi:hypothetical protein
MFTPEMLWSLHFIQAQGYNAECVGLYQDNISTQLLIKNGRMSSGKKTKHIKAKFFFIKDRVDDGEMKVVDCPTKEMWADIMTRPLQGTAFQLMRAELMNCNVNYEDPPEEEESGPVTSRKTVSWKSVVSTTFETPQECVRQNRNLGAWMRACMHGAQMRACTHDAQIRACTHTIQGENTRRRPRGISGWSLGVARLKAATWPVGVCRERKGRE